MQYHPDKNRGATDTTEQFQQVAAAYEILKDPVAKAKYDERLQRQETELKPRQGAWEMAARREKAQRDDFMQKFHRRDWEMEEDSQVRERIHYLLITFILTFK